MEDLKIIKGVTVTLPVIGRIVMGRAELRAGREGEQRAIPVKDDEFHITGLVQNADRSWPAHPIEAKCRKANQKLLQIPVRIAFNSPDLNLQNSYSAFDPATGRAVCAAREGTAKRVAAEGVQTVPCPGPSVCEFGKANRCKNFTRFYVKIEDQDDELGVFILRSTSINTLSALSSVLVELSRLTGGKVMGMPMTLEIVAKSTTQSMRKPVFYARLRVRQGMTLIDAAKAARQQQLLFEEAELDLNAAEQALLDGLANGLLADDLEDSAEWEISDGELEGLAIAGLGGKGRPALDAFLEEARRNAGGPAAVERTGDLVES